MAEAALIGVAKSVLQALASPALDEFRLLWGQKKELQRLQDTVTTIGDVLHDADRRQAGDAAVQGWLTRLRVVLYDADDLFDLISAQVLHNKLKTGNNIVRKVRPFVSFVKTAHKVKDIRERLDAIASDIKGFGFLPVQTALDLPHRFRREQTHSYFPSNEVIGREEEREDIVKLLLPECLPAEQNGVSVVAVIGIGGLGKTTLAQLVYNDEKVQKGFDLCVWACINDFSRLEQVVVTLLESVIKKKVEGVALDTLQCKFRKEIEGKRFLLVVDDVWDEDPQNWHKLKILLDCGKPGSMVLATTRSVKVAQSLSAVEPYYHLSGMSDQSAWLLFKKMAFGGKHLHHNPRLEGLGQQIVKKCANVPLLIVTVASFLRYQEESKWCSLVDGELPTVAPGDYNKVMQALKISYNEFPYPVKRCFAFCSLFPKDYEFQKDKLIRLWIAEGFVEDDDAGRNLEDTVEEYFFYLVDRCFFQNMKMRMEFYLKGVTIYTCQMHDLVHDLAKEVAGSESNLVDQVNAQKPWDNKTLRHLSLVGHVCSVSHPKSLRTFLHFNGGSMGTNTLNELMSSFKALRVLRLSQLGIKEIPASIGELIHLRLLDLSRNKMKRLPSSICSLHHLQSLILQGCWDLKELPEVIGKLISLRHLVVPDCVSSLPAGMVALTSLVTLNKRVVHKPGGELRYLECLDNLSGSLEIDISETGWENVTVDAQTACLSRKSRLKALTIEFESVESGGEVETLLGALEPHPNLEYLEMENFGGKRMPLWVSSLDRLVILKLWRCENSTELAPLSRLPSLRELSVKYMSSMLSIEGSVSYDPVPLLFFPSLEALGLERMPKLRSWWVQAPAVLPKFPRVTIVKIKDCPELAAAGMPLFLLVEVLELTRVQEEVVWHGIGTGTPPQESSLLGNRSALKKCEISHIGGLRSMGEAQIRHLSALRKLRIYNCEQLETVSWRGLAYLTSLEKLVIGRGCEKVKWGVDGDEVPWEPRLRRLEIPNVTGTCLKGLKYLTSLETLCLYNFDEELQTSNSEEEEEEGMPWKPLQKLDRLTLGFGETFSMRGNQQLLRGVEYLTNSLQELTLSHCKELYLSWTTLVSLNRLEKLYFTDVERVINVVDATRLLQLSSISLHRMTIAGGSAEWVLDIPWKSFPSLASLELLSISNLEALPEGIQHLASLQTLRIDDCERVVSLPYWFSSLSSLRRLHICGSSKELKKRCQRVTGEDWPLIQHIQEVDIE